MINNILIYCLCRFLTVFINQNNGSAPFIEHIGVNVTISNINNNFVILSAYSERISTTMIHKTIMKILFGIIVIYCAVLPTESFSCIVCQLLFWYLDIDHLSLFFAHYTFKIYLLLLLREAILLTSLDVLKLFLILLQFYE